MDKELVGKCIKALSEAESAYDDIGDALPLMRGRLDAILPIIIPLIAEEIKGELEREYRLKPNCWARDLYLEGDLIIRGKSWGEFWGRYGG